MLSGTLPTNGYVMKDTRNTINQQSKQGMDYNKKRPEVRDNLDSRKNLEQDFKGSDVTHNQKDVRNQPNRTKR
jgi:hypothetical protein